MISSAGFVPALFHISIVGTNNFKCQNKQFQASERTISSDGTNSFTCWKKQVTRHNCCGYITVAELWLWLSLDHTDLKSSATTLVTLRHFVNKSHVHVISFIIVLTTLLLGGRYIRVVVIFPRLTMSLLMLNNCMFIYI